MNRGPARIVEHSVGADESIVIDPMPSIALEVHTEELRPIC